MKKIVEIEDRRRKLAQGGGLAAVEKQHREGRLTAWERMEKLFDPGTFHELDLWATSIKTGFDIDKADIPRDAILTGWGEINGRVVYASCSDFTVRGGSQGAMYLMKLGKMIHQAAEHGVPYVGIIDSAGRRIEDMFGMWGFRPPIRLPGCEEGALDMFAPPMASGVIPQISLVLGPSYAGTAYSPVMADFIFFLKEKGFMSVASPSLLKSATFVDVTQEEIGGAMLHATTAGTCDILVESDEEALIKCRELLGFLPSNWREKPPVVTPKDHPDREEEFLAKIVSYDFSQPYDVHEVINSIMDDGKFFELQGLYARNMVTGFGHLAGQVIGMTANNPLVADGSLDADACDKAAHFVRTCDAFNIPLVFLVDTPGFSAEEEHEHGREGLERHGAKPIFAICESTVPKMSVYLGRCWGCGHLVMGTKEMGLDISFAWPSADMRLMDPDRLSKSIYSIDSNSADQLKREGLRQQLEEQFPEPYSSAGLLVVDDIIDPRKTRSMLIRALKRLQKKQETKTPRKKYGLVPT